MNRERRKLLAEASDLVERAKTIVEQCRDDEDAYFDAMPESIQSGAKGDRAQSVVGELDEIADQLDETINGINGAIEP